MRILIEEYQYDVSLIRDILHGIDALENIEGRVSVHYVGYYYNSLLKDCVFILPKVLLMDEKGADGVTREKVFGRYLPEQILNLNKENPLEPHEKDFLYKFAVWIYRAIVVYRNDGRCDSDIVYYMKFNKVDKGRRRQSNTYLDILLSLIQFNKDNKNFFFFILKNLHSGFNKINWTRTIGTTSAIVKSGKPIYLDPVNKRKQVNFDEELLVIFYSILNYIGDIYGFPKDLNCQFELITGNKFASYLNGYGKTRLHQIKYKYFSDKALELWNLCYAFFDESRSVFVGSEQKEYLLVKNFYTVFEAIIDELIGDKPLPDGMEKKQEDGKIVDHLFTAPSLIDGEAKQTYYIGDSKYYKIGHELGKESIYKQYTYARNVIQWNLDIFNDGRVPESGIRLRDKLTEGYNIIPNFFISAKMDTDFRYNVDGLEQTDRKKNKHKQIQFTNRLFDRDTLLLFHYDVNFLYVLSLYARNNTSQKTTWKADIRKKFRKEIQDWLQDDYDFYAMKAKPFIDGSSHIKEHFKEVVGKVYTPFKDDEIYSLALDNDKQFEEENKDLLDELRKYFYVEKVELGKDPEEVLPKTPKYYSADVQGKDLVLVGYCKNEEQLALIRKNRLYYVRIGMEKGSMRLASGFEQSKYVLLYNKDLQELYKLSDKGPRIVTGNELSNKGFVVHHEFYLAFDLVDNKPVPDVPANEGKFKIKKSKNRYNKVPYLEALAEMLE